MGAQAVHAVEYERRTAHQRAGETARQVTGHDRDAVRARRSISAFVDDPPRRVVLDGLTRGELRRVARYDALVSNLTQGRISPAEFTRRVRAWRPIRGLHFLADAPAVLALMEDLRAGDVELFSYTAGRSL